jgi:hypothetical protein
MIDFPVFENGLQVGTLTPRTPGTTPRTTRTPGQGEPAPLPRIVDRAGEFEAMQAAIDETVRALNPALFDARRRLLRCLETAARWQSQVSELRWAVSRKAHEAAGTSPDAPVGTRQEREQELAFMRLQLDELEQEHSAASEEVDAAQKVVNSILHGGQ